MAEQARFTIAAEDQFSRVIADAQTQFGNLRATLGSIASIGGALSAGALTAWFKSLVDGIDRFNDLRDASGASVESLSALEDVVIRGGESFDSAADSVTRLNKVLLEAKPGSDYEKIIRGIGLSVRDLRAADPVTALQSVAQALAKFADDGDKARIIQALFGKSAAEVAPILKALSEAGQLNAKVTKEQAEEAERLNKQLAQLKKDSTDAARALASELVPALNDVLARFRSIKKSDVSLFDIGLTPAADDSIDELRRKLKLVQDFRAKLVDINNPLAGTNIAAARIDSYNELERRLRAAVQAQEALTLAEGAYSNEGRNTVQRLGALAAALDGVKEKARFTAEQLKLFRSANEGIAGEFEAREFVLKSYNAELERLNELLGITQTAKLRADLALLDKAFFDGKVSAEKYDAAVARLLGKSTADNIKKTNDAAEQLGLTLSSSIGAFIERGGSIGDFFKSLTQDVMKLIVQLLIVKPLAEQITALFKGGAGGGGGGGNIFGTILGAFGSVFGSAAGSGGSAAPAAGAVKPQGATSITIVNNVGAAYGDAGLAHALEASSRATIARIVDMQQRGRLAMG